MRNSQLIVNFAFVSLIVYMNCVSGVMVNSYGASVEQDPTSTSSYSEPETFISRPFAFNNRLVLNGNNKEQMWKPLQQPKPRLSSKPDKKDYIFNGLTPDQANFLEWLRGYMNPNADQLFAVPNIKRRFFKTNFIKKNPRDILRGLAV